MPSAHKPTILSIYLSLSVCLPLSLCVCVCMHECLCLCLCVCVQTDAATHVCTCIFIPKANLRHPFLGAIHLASFICLPVCSSIHSSICLSVCPSVYQSVHPSIHPSNCPFVTGSPAAHQGGWPESPKDLPMSAQPMAYKLMTPCLKATIDFQLSFNSSLRILFNAF